MVRNGVPRPEGYQGAWKFLLNGRPLIAAPKRPIMSIRGIVERISGRGVELVAVVTVVLGMFVLVAWGSGHWQVIALDRGYVPMAPNTAAVFVALGLAMGATRRWPASATVRAGATGAALTVVVMSGLVIAQAWSYFPVPWDDWVPTTGEWRGAIPLGRMSPLTAIAFILAASGLLLLVALPSVTRLRRWNAAGFATISLLIGTIVAVGHVAGTPLLYGGTTVPMAWLTAGTLVLFSVGLLDFSGIVPGLRRELRDASELRRVENQMRLQSAALTVAANAIVITNRDGLIVWANAAFTSLTGYTVDDATGRNPRDLVKSGRHDSVFYAEMWAQILAGQVWHGELVNRRKDGTMYPEEMTITPVRDAAGEITHFIAIKQDLTERKRAEKELRLFRALVDQSDDTIEVVDPESGRFLDVNEKGSSRLGYTRAEYLSLGVFDIDPTVDVSAWPQIAEKIRAAGLVKGEGRHRRKDGTTFPVEFSTGLVRLDRDYFVTVVRDVSERKKAEAALRQEQDRLNSLLTTIPDRIYFKDQQSRFVRINESLARLFGLGGPAEAIGKSDADFFLGEHSQQTLADEQGIIATGEPVIGAEEKETWPDGRITWVSSTKMPLRDEQGRISGLVGISRDITEHKLLEEKFLHAQRLESIGMLAAGIAHDLNNVLAPIMFAAPMLRDSLGSERDLRILATLEKSAQRGAALVKQILGFAHATTGDFRSTQVKHLARDIVSVVEETFPKNIELRHEVPSDLWPVLGNPTQIHQVLMNLCVNARDAMPQGGTLSITAANRRLDAAEAAALAGGRPGDWLMLTVSDTGSGIPP